MTHISFTVPTWFVWIVGVFFVIHTVLDAIDFVLRRMSDRYEKKVVRAERLLAERKFADKARATQEGGS